MGIGSDSTSKMLLSSSRPARRYGEAPSAAIRSADVAVPERDRLDQRLTLGLAGGGAWASGSRESAEPLSVGDRCGRGTPVAPSVAVCAESRVDSTRSEWLREMFAPGPKSCSALLLLALLLLTLLLLLFRREEASSRAASPSAKMGRERNEIDGAFLRALGEMLAFVLSPPPVS